MNEAPQGSRSPARRWGVPWPALRRPDGGPSSWVADAAVSGGLFGLGWVVVALATAGAGGHTETAISLAYGRLPLYAAYSVLRMLAAYALSMAFSLVYGYVAATSRRAERVMLPLLDILQSVPILSFMPSVVLAMTGLFPHSSAGAEIASVILVFTSQAWNLTFSFYNSLLTVPRELREVSRMYGMSWWQRFRQLELPAAAMGLVWNSMMSWSGGWFFLMAAEMFTLGTRSYHVPGLGSYLQQAANAGNGRAVVAGLGTLVLVIVAFDQLVWRPAIAWADRFKIEMVAGGAVPRSTVLILLRRSLLVEWAAARVLTPAVEWVDRQLSAPPARPRTAPPGATSRVTTAAAGIAFGFVAAYAAYKGIVLLGHIPAQAAARIPLAALLTTARVMATLALSVLWTVPVGVFIGTNRDWADRLQPVVQILASFPATAVYPLIVLAIGGLGWLSVGLMLLGTQWYVLFNVIAGAISLPQDLKEATSLFGLGRWQRWRTLILPGIFPSLVTGLITASGGAWNAAIVTEYVQTGAHAYATLGLGSLIAQASAHAQYGLLLGSTLSLSAIVVVVNRLFWRRLYRLAETRYTLSS